MKYSIPLICFLVFVSCAENRQVRTAMDQAESCMSATPDSALSLVRGIKGPSLVTKGLRARHALLLTMALDKCYFDVSEDSTIRVAYDYYKYHGSKRNRLLSTYYLGVIQQNGGEYINAALSFREAEPLAEELEDYRQLSLIEQHLSRIFSSNYDQVRAMEYAEQALDAAEKAGEDLMADYCRLDIVELMLASFRYDEAERELNLLRQKNKGTPVMYSYITKLLSHALLFKETQDFRGAEKCYQDVLALDVVQLNAEDYGRLALIKEIEGDSSSADSFLKIAESYVRTKIDSLVFYNDCYNVFDRRGDWRNARKNLLSRAKLQDEIEMGLLSQSVTHAMESYYLDNLVIEKLRSRSRMITSGLIGIVLLGFIIMLSFMIKRKNRQLLEDLERIHEVSEDVDRLRLKGSTTSQIIEKLIADKIQSLQQLSESYFSWGDDAFKKREEKEGTFLLDEILASFRMQLSELRKDHSFIASLEQSLNLSYDGIMDKARQCLNTEKDIDYSVLTLLFSGFSIKSISFLLRMSEASLRMRKTRYKQQFEAMQEPFRSLFLEKLRC